MTDLESLERQLRQTKAHAESLEAALREANKRNVQVDAQFRYIRECAELRIKQAADLIDQLHSRIEAMVDEWEAQIRFRFNGTEAELAKALESAEAFRPQRVGVAEVSQ